MNRHEYRPQGPLKFRTWLLSHVDHATPLGELARNIKADPKASRIEAPGGLQRHLAYRPADLAVARTAMIAWRKALGAAMEKRAQP